MDGIQGRRLSLPLRLLRIWLFSSLLIGIQTALLLDSDAANQHLVSPKGAIMSSRSTLFLYRSCGASSTDQVSWCEGYLMGLADILLAMGNSRMAGGICNAEYDAISLNRIFRAWTEQRPERWNDDMAVSAQASFREVWPCR